MVMLNNIDYRILINNEGGDDLSPPFCNQEPH